MLKNQHNCFRVFFFIENTSFLICIFLSAFWPPASLKVKESVLFYQLLISSWASLNCGRLMLVGPLSPVLFSPLPFAFPPCPCLSGTLWCLPSKAEFNTSCVELPRSPHLFKASVLPGMCLQTMQREKSQWRSEWCLLSRLCLQSLLIFR